MTDPSTDKASRSMTARYAGALVLEAVIILLLWLLSRAYS
jgi:hypothetical protein